VRRNSARHQAQVELPNYFKCVAEDVLGQCRPQAGIWVDLGSGSGGLGFALAHKTTGCVILVDPSRGALAQAVRKAQQLGLSGRVRSVVGVAETLPLADDSVELIVSRGSIFFWQDRARGLRESLRVLRPGGCARIGGGFGSAYPRWARQEFFRRRDGSLKKKGSEALKSFKHATKPERLADLVKELAIPGCKLVSDVPGELGTWILFRKREVI